MHYTIKTTKNSFLWLDLFVSYFCIFIQLCLFLSILYIQLAFSSEELFNLFLASICKIKVFPKLKLYYIKFFFGIHFCRYLMSTLLISNVLSASLLSKVLCNIYLVFEISMCYDVLFYIS